VDLKTTPLHRVYKEYGAKAVGFGGFDMPVQFSGIIEEHEAVRSRAGLFDVSHMGEFEVVGEDARAFIQYMVTNDVSKLEPGFAMYSPMTYENGGCVDDLLVYCFSMQKFWIVVNAGNIDKDFAWLDKHTEAFHVELTDKSNEISLLALQGPLSDEILSPLAQADISTLRPFRFIETKVGGIPVVLSRTGYTGENGFELYTNSEHVESLWRLLMEKGQPYGLLPCGLGARDTLRLEARLPLYGHELTEEISPLEAGIGMFVKLDAGDFVGREALLAQKTNGISRKVVGIRLLDRGVPRGGYTVFESGTDKVVGQLTSGTMSPTLKQPVGLALVEKSVSEIGTHLDIEIRNKRIPAEVIKTPFYKRSK
jgi:aminomethyltransferase